MYVLHLECNLTRRGPFVTSSHQLMWAIRKGHEHQRQTEGQKLHNSCTPIVPSQDKQEPTRLTRPMCVARANGKGCRHRGAHAPESIYTSLSSHSMQHSTMNDKKHCNTVHMSACFYTAPPQSNMSGTANRSHHVSWATMEVYMREMDDDCGQGRMPLHPPAY
jgi:hypothetical protein